MGKNIIILCDTDVIIEFYRNNSEIITALRNIGQENIAISTITAGELIYGAFNKKEPHQIEKDINNLQILEINSKTCSLF